MFYLAFDVFDQAILLAKGRGEGAVTVLPAFKTREIGLAFQPMAAAGLNFLNVLGNCQCSGQSGQNVNVVVHAADAVEVTIQVAMNSPNVLVECVALTVGQGPLTILRRKDNVE